MQSLVRDGRLLLRLVSAKRHDPCDIHARHDAHCAVSHFIHCLCGSIGVKAEENYMDGVPPGVNVQLRLHDVP